MESVAPISDLITGTVLYNRMIEDIISGETELTLTEYRILFFLEHIEGARARVRTLAGALILSSSTVSDATKNLESTGLVEKTDQHNDLKAVWISITETGREALIQASEAIERETREYWSIIGKEVAAAYFTNADRLTSRWEHPLSSMLALPEPIRYAFISHWHLLSYVSWFKSTYNLSLIDVRILMVLLERDGKLTCTDTAHLLKVSNSTVSNSARYLNRVKSYVERTRGLSGHAVEIGLTCEGDTRIREIRERFIRFNLEQFDFTHEEFEAMLHTVHPRRRKSYMQKVFGESFAEG